MERGAADARVGKYPDLYLHHDDWRDLFGLAGYTHNGAAAERPHGTLRLYRGSVAERRDHHWSWTDRLEIATGYARGTRARRPLGKVWQADVEPWRLMARNGDPEGRNESEYVVDTAGLVIVEHAN